MLSLQPNLKDKLMKAPKSDLVGVEKQMFRVFLMQTSVLTEGTVVVNGLPQLVFKLAISTEDS